MRDDEGLTAAERRRFNEIVRGFADAAPYHRDAATEARIEAARQQGPRARGWRWPRRRRGEPR